ncbi:propanol-preferring alcohol dehydrogenase [Amycolatopsis thermoflava]|uniref:alcohol dehydrogenase n=1 Tax=Amycolatopsis thermoflava TaxID=84480 RepID=A0A3N2G6A3_9PSEU|nr:NAD(P)-dependent alcohol dehydrogenase [Amycolatopsis thermoflava]ROS32166.1 propanol-preferring alcohol dehydrogenase [Amycolatopsis thermoflava]
MKALQYRRFGGRPELVDVPRPLAGAGQVLIRVTAAGVCHSDLHIMSVSEHEYRYGPLPLTLGHEAAGVVAATGDGAGHFSVGDPVLVYGPWGCGQCRNCSQGKENYCSHPDGVRPPGIARPGAMAEYLLVDHERHLIPLGGLDPVQAVSLTDAGLTSYHAVKQSAPKLGAGRFAVVIGAGGLGHAAIQILRAISPATVIAVDIAEDKLRFAMDVGAHHAVPGDEQAAETVRDLTGGRGADAIFDFVGSQRTVELAGGVVATEGDIVIVGVGPGRLPVGYRSLPFDATVRAPFWGSRPELWEVTELARAGHLRIEVETYSLDDAPLAYDRLASGAVRGRAVVTPGGCDR